MMEKFLNISGLTLSHITLTLSISFRIASILFKMTRSTTHDQGSFMTLDQPLFFTEIKSLNFKNAQDQQKFQINLRKY